jgi:hypothetical protein
MASLLAYFLACFRLLGFNPSGMSDGGGLL